MSWKLLLSSFATAYLREHTKADDSLKNHRLYYCLTSNGYSAAIAIDSGAVNGNILSGARLSRKDWIYFLQNFK
ncbi:hypothetical protein DKT75_06335 [Leucothrix arctica]|uniref:Uncharacterized protein n=1 Tax=Leucothrix arctica TaxID=1481894 RepID=A0A317CG48_9GAMM|nr:hypothetical protein DKT75_06335 [Leucothrix arctica]